jgi:ribosomal protein S18 acetylase RimI-like enzyme
VGPSCCELLQLWVAAQFRSQGVGSRLMHEFEARARTRGCNIFYLTTLSFQAPEFYRRHGYDVLARIDGYPNGIVKYLMHRAEALNLASDGPGTWFGMSSGSSSNR